MNHVSNGNAQIPKEGKPRELAIKLAESIGFHYSIASVHTGKALSI